jgi:hypothetical protein
MSRVRTVSPIDDIDRIAKEEGVESLVSTTDGGRVFEAFGRRFIIEEATPGKVGIFKVTSTPLDAGRDKNVSSYEGFETHERIQKLMRRAVKWRERVA